MRVEANAIIAYDTVKGKHKSQRARNSDPDGGGIPERTGGEGQQCQSPVYASIMIVIFVNQFSWCLL